MKTSVIEVHNMLSVWSLEEVEKRIGDVPGVESVTVNYAASSATVRYDETRLEIADIKSAVRQNGYESANASADEDHEGHTTPGAAPISALSPPKTPPVVLVSPAAASAGTAPQDEAVPDAVKATTPKLSSAASNTAPAIAALSDEDRQDKDKS